nr:WYL domain-containing protein [Microbacterium neungamense]
MPLVVGSRGARWYLLGAPAQRGTDAADESGLRTYRVDRLSSLEPLDLPGLPPSDFDAAATWARMVERVEGLRGAVRAVVEVDAWAVRALCDRFGVQARLLDHGASAEAPSRVRVEVSAHRADALAEQLAGWVDVAEVVEPAEVRVALRMLGERIVARYRDA